MKRIELWLPQGCAVELQSLRVSQGARVEPAPPKLRRWIHYGSSISQCAEAERPTGVWPVVAARRADVELVNLGFGGQCHLDQVVARAIRDAPADLISLKLGINVVNADSFRERTFVPALHGLLDTVRDGHPNTPLIVLTPISCPAAEDHPGPTPIVDGRIQLVDRPTSLELGALSLGRIRELIEMVVTSRRQRGDSDLHLRDGRSLLGDDDVADLPDGLHPTSAAYQRMGERFASLAFGDHGPFDDAMGSEP